MAHSAIDPHIHLRQSVRWLPADTETPISLYMKVVGNDPGILLESAEVDGRWGRFSILACDMLAYVRCKDGNLDLEIRDDRLAPLSGLSGLPFIQGFREFTRGVEIHGEKTGPELPPITRALYGFMGFGMASVFDPHLAAAMPVDEADCCLALPGTVLVFDHLYNRLCQLSLGEHRPIPANLAASGEDRTETGAVKAVPGEEGYKEYVRFITRQLGQGEAIQVVPSCRFSAPFSGNPFMIYRRMRRFNASPYMFYMQFPDLTLFGSSPEVMVRCSANVLQLSPIAGTRRRGKNHDEDEALAAELLRDPKERAEHVMLVDLGRNDLGAIARPGTVQVEKFMQVEKFSHVMHLTSSLTAQLKEGYDAIDVLGSTFPAGTVSGAPKTRAMEIIRQLEGFARGPYAGCIGWIGLDEDTVNLDMGITLRSMWVKGDEIHWQAGGGIVHDSDPELEWKEICNKSAIMRLALNPEDSSYVPADR